MVRKVRVMASMAESVKDECDDIGESWYMRAAVRQRFLEERERRRK